MKIYTISVDSIGFCAVYTVLARDVYSAKRKAKKMAIRDFISDMVILKEDY